MSQPDNPKRPPTTRRRPAPPIRPDDRGERQTVLLNEILATRRLKKMAPARAIQWALLTLLYLPFGIFLIVARQLLLTLYMSLGLTVLPKTWAASLAANLVFPLLGWRMSTKGLEHIRTAKDTNQFFVLSANHVSYADSVIIIRLLRVCGIIQQTTLASTLMGGKEQWEISKRLGLTTNTLYTKGTQSTPEEKRQTRKEIEAMVAEQKNSSNPIPLILFPEGQVHNADQYLLRYEKFCFGLGAPVLPVATRFHCPWPLHLWVVDDNPLFTFTLLFAMPWVRWDYTVLPMMEPTPGEEVHEFARRVQHTTADTLGVWPTEFSVKDVSEAIELYRT